MKEPLKKYCVIGYPVSHSRSPKIHNKWFREKGILAKYEKAEVAPADLGAFMASFAEKYDGANVTIPHKEAVMKYLDVISPEARKIGAVNTIVMKRGASGHGRATASVAPSGRDRLVGYNTDCAGAMEALKSVLKRRESLRGKQVVVLGAGGAARAVVYGLKKAGAKVLILNRTLSHAKKLAKEFRCMGAGLPVDFVCRGAPRKSAAEFDIVINATSVGMKNKNETPLSSLRHAYRQAGRQAAIDSRRSLPRAGSRGENDIIVMDLVYVPRMTRLLKDAKKAGCRIVLGEKMLLAQARKSFELWMAT